MLRKVPIVAVPIEITDLLAGFNAFSRKLSPGSEPSDVFFADSATACLYTFLQILKGQSDKQEVILPAYTASTLVIAIQKAGLKPVLCDIRLTDFNMDPDSLRQIITEKTLAIIGVHMFGIVDAGLGNIKKQFPEIIVIEDCCQAMGSEIDREFVGKMTDVSLFSFNRGKNIPTYGGGCLGLNIKFLIDKIKQSGVREQPVTLAQELKSAVKLMALAVIMRPWVYGAALPFIAGLKEKAPAEDFAVQGYTKFQLGVLGSLLKKMKSLSQQRYINGMKLIEGLQKTEGVCTPEIAKNTKPAFNRLPVLFNDPKEKETTQKNLSRSGIETSQMYFKPLHHIFALGYKKEEFSNAVYLAQHLLTLPTHPLLADSDIEKIIKTIRRVVK
ncbi:MAG: DegT/DnrJ/EryC1/StrS family aminotransferase [Candidatus Omnitrophota bacterium]